MSFRRCLLVIYSFCFPLMETLAAEQEEDRPRFVQMLQIKTTAYNDSIKQNSHRKLFWLMQPPRLDSRDLLKDLSALLTFQDRLQIDINDRENDTWLAGLGATAEDVLWTVHNINEFLEKRPPYWGLFFQRIFRLHPKLLERGGQYFILHIRELQWKESEPICDDSGKTIILEFEILIHLANLMKSAGIFHFRELEFASGIQGNRLLLRLLEEMNQSPRLGIWSSEFLKKLFRRLILKNEYQLEVARDLLLKENGNSSFQFNRNFRWYDINYPGQVKAILAFNSIFDSLPERLIEPLTELVLEQPCEGSAAANLAAYCHKYDNWRIKDTIEAISHILVDLPQVGAISTSAEVLWSAFSHYDFLNVPPSQLAWEVELGLKTWIFERESVQKSVQKIEKESDNSRVLNALTPELQRLVKNVGVFAIDCLHHFSEFETKLLAEKIMTPEGYNFCEQMMKENINPIHLLNLINQRQIQIKKGEWMHMFRFLKSNNHGYAACLARQAKGHFKTPLKAAATLGTYDEHICQQVADDQNRLLEEIESAMTDSTDAELVAKIRRRITLLINHKDWDFDISGACPSCYEETDESNPLIRFHEGSCGFCWNCMRELLKSEVNSGTAQCPCLDDNHKKCGMLLPRSYTDAVLTDIDSRTKINFYRRTVLALSAMYAELGSDTKFQICPNNKCFKLLRGTNEVVDCSDCGESHCFNCDKDHDANSDCDDYQKWLQENSNSLQKRKLLFTLLFSKNSLQKRKLLFTLLFSKKCPGCKERITKGEGCNHMTCIFCGYQFHWDTLEPYRVGMH